MIIARQDKVIEALSSKQGGFSWPTICKSCPIVHRFPFGGDDPGFCCEQGNDDLLVQLIVKSSLGINITEDKDD